MSLARIERCALKSSRVVELDCERCWDATGDVAGGSFKQKSEAHSKDNEREASGKGTAQETGREGETLGTARSVKPSRGDSLLPGSDHSLTPTRASNDLIVWTFERPSAGQTRLQRVTREPLGLLFEVARWFMGK